MRGYVREILQASHANGAQVPDVDLTDIRALCQSVISFVRDYQMPGVPSGLRLFGRTDSYVVDEVGCCHRLLCAVGPCFLCYGKRQFEIEHFE